jgi:metal-responsive CopG/Arc/MetJ family transcriptional regulator
MRTISIKIPESLNSTLKEIARRQGISRSEVIRKSLETPTRHHGKQTVGDQARDLAGCLAGPRDLSTSAKHMKGYGK